MDDIPASWIVTLAEAVSRGEKRYFTGKPCKRGHIAHRYVMTSACTKCITFQQAQRRRALNSKRLLDAHGFVDVTVKVNPEDALFIRQTADLLKMQRLRMNGANYIKLLSDYARALLASDDFMHLRVDSL